jgi:hypothetical protein
MVDMLSGEISNYTAKELSRLLHNSTITKEMHIYDIYEDIIENGDILDRNELYSILVMNQRDEFIEMENISNKAINKRLDRVMLLDKM